MKNGTGSGSYKVGEAVEIHADIPEGEHFTKWEAEGISLSEEESQDAKLTLDMPSEAVRLTALSETDSHILQNQYRWWEWLFLWRRSRINQGASHYSFCKSW